MSILDELKIPTIEEVLQRYYVPLVVSVERDCIVLGNISCTDHTGKVFEHYDRLRVERDIVRNSDGSEMEFTPYRAAEHFEKEGKFSPSFALSCNILKVLYENRKDKEVSKVLMQYKERGNGYGWHTQNTIVDWGGSKIIHYPSDKDFPQYGGSSDINSGRRIEFASNNKGFKDMPLEEALKNPDFKNHITDLTGLEQPETLIEIGKHFKKPAYAWISSNSEVCAAWLGCSSNYFSIDIDNDLKYSYATRGVSSP